MLKKRTKLTATLLLTVMCTSLVPATIAFAATGTTSIATTSTTTVKVTGLQLSKTSLSVLKGSTSTLTATVSPSSATNKGVTWKSSNTAVATVDSNGKVTAVAAGTVTITCTAKDGSGKYAKCTVTVTNPVKVTSVTLSKTSLSLLKGSTSTLTATVLPTSATNKGVTWKSSNTAVATVDSNGKVTAVAAGTVTITSTAKDGSGKYAKCTVTVTNPVKVTSIALNSTSLSLLPGSTSALTAKVLPTNATNKGVTWKSSNTAVATVDANGKVTAVAVGTVTITCTANDGSGKYAKCTLTVNPIKVTSIALNSTSLSLLPGSTSALTAKVSPTNATNKGVTWTSDKPAIAKVDSNGKVTAVAAGTAVITCTAADGSGKSVKCTVNVANAAKQIIGSWKSEALDYGVISIDAILNVTSNTVTGKFSGSSVTLPYTIIKDDKNYCQIQVEYKGRKHTITFKFNDVNNINKVNIESVGTTLNFNETFNRIK